MILLLLLLLWRKGVCRFKLKITNVDINCSHHCFIVYLKFPGYNLFVYFFVHPFLILKFQVDVLQSLQKPKKITIKGSDGKTYTMMCKPKVSSFSGQQIIFPLSISAYSSGYDTWLSGHGPVLKIPGGSRFENLWHHYRGIFFLSCLSSTAQPSL